ncbi:DUF5329 family protein [Hydrogenophaga sp. RWCD_12]|uniref:DUF5329 family protein n=1 Tax=Hydrogenophaga sp. RWCD_12 TaxID=3391190 RepID=UPI0039851AA6
MFIRRQLAFVAITLLLLNPAMAAPAPPAVRAEIDAVFKKLQVPGCQFNRNGSWYTGAEAQSHLMRKLEYLEDKDLVKTTEDFITLGASTSSSSGKAYQVRCGDAVAVESKVWLLEQLKSVRRGK